MVSACTSASASASTKPSPSGASVAPHNLEVTLAKTPARTMTIAQPASPPSTCLDPLDVLLDFSAYESTPFATSSPKITTPTSPLMKHLAFARPMSNTSPVLLTSKPILSGPSHQYDLYKQQTGLPQGAIASTLAVNQNNAHISTYGSFADAYLSGLSATAGPAAGDEYLDFGTAPTPTFTDTNMDYDSPADEASAFYYQDQHQATDYIDPNAMTNLLGESVASSSSLAPPRLWPGMHQQQALAKAQAQQRQQQTLIQQQQRDVKVEKSDLPRKSGPTDPVVEEKITQLLHSMRHGSVLSEDAEAASSGQPGGSSMRMRRDDDEMDEDERLLASEEGKKLSSKERRQLRNKVSARAFRSRRKEYISQLEGEIAGKVNENHSLRLHNKALMEENTRLSDLTRMLLSSPAFSNFLDTLASNPAAAQLASSHIAPPQVPQHHQQGLHQQQQAPPPLESSQRAPQPPPKDSNPNPYAAQHLDMQHVGMTMVPEHRMDYSLLEGGGNVEVSHVYQPRVYSVLSIPGPVLDPEVLSGKGKSLLMPLSMSATFEEGEGKVEREMVKMPVVAEVDVDEVVMEEEDDEEEEPFMTLFSSATSRRTAPVSDTKTAATFTLPDLALACLNLKPVCHSSPSKTSSTPIAASTAASPPSPPSSQSSTRRIQRLCAKLDATAERLSRYC